ncbi:MULTISPECIES: chromate transporter [unclassified Herbaspirillum]|uniref:chromate transporter n=1 Tax=unclassified Herbaspirillum TaxID=2624150 RepID=UPI000E2F660C|nr:MULTISPECIES: chromate transporter [unclassified Herbaspirillum]RFB74348.1 chromate transporter [Herbaspirillum sp. 3R-3a1]TFI10076.1 chromate transporter [Herbaspirillum sp. 3R11]TFI15980.1 chromate transporter [Herbaspirillum sp. 3R-11]TFI23430.1 chromate transporter [Herbaspirillum sp. 3C11]
MLNDNNPLSSAPPVTPEIRVVPTSRELFLGFLGLGMTAFGGALPLAHRMVVERHRWLTEAEFVELLGLCQFLPGGNIINLSVALGMRFRGVKGALAAIFGLIAVPSMVVVMLGILYQHYQHDPLIKHLFAGLAAAASGLLIQMAVKIALPLRKNLVLSGLATICFIAIAWLRIPLLWTMLVMTPVSVLVTAKFGGKNAPKDDAKKGTAS